MLSFLNRKTRDIFHLIWKCLSLDNITICYFIITGQFFHAELYLLSTKPVVVNISCSKWFFFFLSPEDICHFEAPAYIIGSCMKVLFISWNGFYWKEMHFHVNDWGLQPHTAACLLDFGSTHSSFYWFLAGCWGHMFWTFLAWFVRFCWHPGKCCKKTCCSYPSLCVSWQSHELWAQVSWQQVLFMEKQT